MMEIHRIAIVFQNKNKSTETSMNVGLSTFGFLLLRNFRYLGLLVNFFFVCHIGKFTMRKNVFLEIMMCISKNYDMYF